MTTYTLPYTGEQISTRLAAVTNHDHTLSDITDIVLPGSASVYLNGNGAWATPTASGSVFKPGVYIGGTGSGADYECDGTADDVQFQAAFDSALSGSTIYILPGTYNIAAKVTMSSSAGKVLHVVGIGKVIINFNCADSDYGSWAFKGSQTATPTLSSNAAQGAVSIVVNSVVGIQVGDLIKIYKDIKWCPTIYAAQQTGEMYEIQGISGTTLTLNQPLIRAYDTADTVTILVYRPVEVHIENIEFRDKDSTGACCAVSIFYAKNSSIKNCISKDSGYHAFSFYSCFNVEAVSNTISNCLKEGSGYGIGIWNATAFANIHDNRIENCRHCITGNASEYLALIRDVDIHHNVFVGGDVVGANVIDAHTLVINYRVVNNTFHLKKTAVVGFPFAFLDGTLHSVFSNNEIFGSYGGIALRDTTFTGAVHIIENNVMQYSTGPLFQGENNGTGEMLIIRNNTSDDGEYGVRCNLGDSYNNYIIEGNVFNSNSQNVIDIANIPAAAKVVITNNKITDCSKSGISITGTSGTAFDATVSGNEIINPNVAGSTHPGISITYMTYATLGNNKIYDNNANGGTGITLGTGCDYNVLIGNVAKGMIGTKFSLTGSNNFPATANVETLNHSF